MAILNFLKILAWLCRFIIDLIVINLTFQHDIIISLFEKVFNFQLSS